MKIISLNTTIINAWLDMRLRSFRTVPYVDPSKSMGPEPNHPVLVLKPLHRSWERTEDRVFSHLSGVR